MTLRRVVQIVAPLVAILTLMIGLRVGAGEAVRAAVVFGFPPGSPAPDGKTRLAWQVLTFLDDRGVKETIPMRGLTVVARAKGKESTWSGETNLDGVAEVPLALEGLAEGDDLDVEVRLAGDPSPLASGRAKWSGQKAEEPRDAASVRPTSKSGPITVDVVIEGGRLVPGFATPVWVRMSPASAAAGKDASIEIATEPGLLVDKERVTPCKNGWAEIPMTAQAHITGSRFTAHGGQGGGESPAKGDWFGPMPVAAGAFFIGVPRTVAESAPLTAVLVAPNPRTVVYAELHDRKGRVAAAALPVAVEPGDPTPRARFALPPLAPGVYWVVASGEPRGGENLAGAAIGRPFLVGSAPAGSGIDASDTCSVGPWLAQKATPAVARWVAVDGLPARSASNRSRYRLGMLIAMVSLLAAAILEALILAAASREARIVLELAELDETDPSAQKVTARPPGGSLLIAILVAVLGFALLAALLVAKG